MEGSLTFLVRPRSNEAIAKTFRIDRTWSLGLPDNWQPICTQTLTSAIWNFTDPESGKSDTAFYRAVWVK